jgi:muramoyltetrapeptide carboxypeptidase
MINKTNLKSRRAMLQKLMLTAAALPTLAAVNASAAVKSASDQPLIKPPRLKLGDLVGLIAPAGVMTDDKIQSGVKKLESIGFKVKVGTNIRAAHGGYAGTVRQRLDDFHAAFTDKDVKGVWVARGGSGCNGLLPGIQYGLIRQHPKVLVGYSDITALHLALYRLAGLVTFHGPVAGSAMPEYALKHLLAVLMEPQPTYTIPMAAENAAKAVELPHFALQTLRAGVAEGRLIGGNLSVMMALIGTPFGADIRDKLLFLEDVSEPSYKVDRMLHQLDQNQGLANAAGCMLGVFTRSESRDNEASLTMAEVLNSHFAALKTPSVYGYSFGHIPHQFTIPVGIRARLDTAAQTLTLLESAVL